ncbi:MAG: glycosyltransferase family 2 protein [Rivularia sp. (in: cyanobacteria)]
MKPLVSVVIPTFRRAQLVKRAAISALAQTLKEIEVIVVIDGPHSETIAALKDIEDTRLKVLELPTNQGCFAARSAGVQAASAEWVAHLDDDDEWMPRKLELQLTVAKDSRHQYPIVSCYLIARTLQGDAIWPRRKPEESESLSEYLFVRNTFFQGEGLIQASTIFTKRELLLKILPEEIKTNRHEDWDWILQATKKQGVGVEFAEEVLSIWHLEQNHQTLSKSGTWQVSFDWIKSKRDLVTPRAYSSFILAEVSARAAATGDVSVLLILLREAFAFGKPQPMDICLCFGMWIFPPNVRGKLRNILKRNRKVLAVDMKSEGAY